MLRGKLRPAFRCNIFSLRSRPICWLGLLLPLWSSFFLTHYSFTFSIIVQSSMVSPFKGIRKSVKMKIKQQCIKSNWFRLINKYKKYIVLSFLITDKPYEVVGELKHLCSTNPYNTKLHIIYYTNFVRFPLVFTVKRMGLQMNARIRIIHWQSRPSQKNPRRVYNYNK